LPVWLYHLGRAADFLAVLRRGETSDRELTMSDQPKLSEELEKMEYEPILPIEKKLVGWSIAIGVVLLGVLVLFSRSW
jgi:hypothetical protein